MRCDKRGERAVTGQVDRLMWLKIEIDKREGTTGSSVAPSSQLVAVEQARLRDYRV